MKKIDNVMYIYALQRLCAHYFNAHTKQTQYQWHKF